MKTTWRVLVVLLSVFLMITGFAVGQVPQLINYQGVLIDPGTGLPVPDNTYSITFSIYDFASGGSAIWTELQSVQTKDGLYNALLGSTTSLTPTIFSGAEKYLGIKVGSDPEMTPRKRIVSVAYAYIAKSVSGTSNVFPSDGSVGIGTNNPSEALDVAGTVKMTGFQLTTAPAAEYVLTSDETGFGTWQPSNGGLMLPYYAMTPSSMQSEAFYIVNTGTNDVGRFEINNSSNGGSAINAVTNGTGHALRAITYGIGGNAGDFYVDNHNNSNYALKVLTLGTGEAGNFRIANVSNGSNAVTCKTQGTGRAGCFFIDNASNSNDAFLSETNGTGSALVASHNGSSGDLAIFQSDGVNEARIDKTGKGFFNGGTQTGGADVAEAFEVEGAINSYEPGDVLVISTNHDNRIEKCSSAYSTLVAGVYATKPGVLLSERHIDDSLDDTIPLGIVGVIPIKVSGENGPIWRGDLLVTSNTPGHAMKGTERDRMLGAIIGKALENFDESGTGVIKVLVNIK